MLASTRVPSSVVVKMAPLSGAAVPLAAMPGSNSKDVRPSSRQAATPSESPTNPTAGATYRIRIDIGRFLLGRRARTKEVANGAPMSDKRAQREQPHCPANPRTAPQTAASRAAARDTGVAIRLDGIERIR